MYWLCRNMSKKSSNTDFLHGESSHTWQISVDVSWIKKILHLTQWKSSFFPFLTRFAYFCVIVAKKKSYCESLLILIQGFSTRSLRNFQVSWFCEKESHETMKDSKDPEKVEKRKNFRNSNEIIYGCEKTCKTFSIWEKWFWLLFRSWTIRFELE